MKLEYLTLCDFRNVSCQTIEFCDGLNLLYGNNAEGKTNAVEAAYIFACAKSFRTNKNRELVLHGKEKSAISCEFSSGKRKVRLKTEIYRQGAKRIYKNGAKLDRLSEFLGQFRVVLFCPEHLSLIKDGPSVRRSFIDAAICQLKPGYAALLHEYSLISVQRAALLRNIQLKKCGTETLDIWSERLSADAAKIIPIRRKYIEKLDLLASEQYANISQGRERLALSYQCDVPEAITEENEIREYYSEMLSSSVETDIKYGYTTHGIGRDDLILSVDGESARSFCSQGQQRSCVLALKLAEGEISFSETGEYPVFLFDDILSELDPKRQSFILSKLDGKQVILTDCTKSKYRSLGIENKICVRGGTYEKKD